MPRRLKDELERLMDCVVSTFTPHISNAQKRAQTVVGWRYRVLASIAYL